MPRSRAKAAIRFASSQSNICPDSRRIGLSISDRAHLGGHPAAGRAREHGFDVGAREGGRARRERHQRQARQRLAGVASVVVDVAHLRDDDAALRCRPARAAPGGSPACPRA